MEPKTVEPSRSEAAGNTLQFRVKGPTPDAPDRTLTLAGDHVVIGRSRAADLRLPHPEVSGAHARILCRQGALLIEDLGSINGTRVDDQLLTPGRLTPLAPASVVEIAGYLLRVTAGSEPSELAGAEGTATLASLLVREMLAGQGGPESLPRLTVTAPRDERRLVLLHPGRPVVVGRGPSAGEQIDDPDLSREHVVFRAQPAGVTAQDLGSKNGVYVNDRRIGQETTLRDGDHLRFGGCRAEFDDPAERLLGELDASDRPPEPPPAEEPPEPARPLPDETPPRPARVPGALARGLLILFGLLTMGLAVWGLWRLFG